MTYKEKAQRFYNALKRISKSTRRLTSLDAIARGNMALVTENVLRRFMRIFNRRQRTP
jgi:hypothetical protein